MTPGMGKSTAGNRLAAGSLAVVTAVGLSACGSASSAGALSSTQLAARVNAACSSYQTSVSTVAQPPGFAQNPLAAAPYLQQVRPLLQAEYEKIKALVPDPRVKARFATFVADSARELSLFDAAVAKAEARDPAVLSDLRAANAFKLTVLTPLALKLGFTACTR